MVFQCWGSGTPEKGDYFSETRGGILMMMMLAIQAKSWTGETAFDINRQVGWNINILVSERKNTQSFGLWIGFIQWIIAGIRKGNKHLVEVKILAKNAWQKVVVGKNAGSVAWWLVSAWVRESQGGPSFTATCCLQMRQTKFNSDLRQIQKQIQRHIQRQRQWQWQRQRRAIIHSHLLPSDASNQI